MPESPAYTMVEKVRRYGNDRYFTIGGEVGGFEVWE